MASLLLYVGGIILSLVALLFYRFYLRPKMLLSFYQKQGLKTEYIPPLGHFTRLRTDFEVKGDSFMHCKENAKEDPKMPMRAINFVDNVLVCLCNTEIMREYYKKPNVYKKVDYHTNILKTLSGENILLSSGETWKKHRKVVSNYFHYQFLCDKIPAIRDIVVEFYEHLAKGSMQKIDVMHEMEEITGEIIGRLFFSEKTYDIKLKTTGRSLQIEIAYLLNDLMIEGRSPLCFLFGPSVIKKGWTAKQREIMARINDLRDTSTALIQARRKSGEKKGDLLDLLLESQSNTDASMRMDDVEILNTYISFIGAGMDTTGHLVTMALYNLMKYPEWFEDLRKEREAKYDSSKVTNDMLKDLVILDAFLKETLRIHTPVPAPMPMVALQTHTLGNYTIKAGTYLRPDYFFTNFSEQFFPDPHKFNPNRWIEQTDLKDPFAFTPFSAGPRNCIGQHLSMIEAKIMMCEFLNRFDYKCSIENYQPKMTFRMLYDPIPDFVIDCSLKKGR